MKVLRFKNNRPEWDIPLPELAPAIKRALRVQWREWIHEIEDLDEQRTLMLVNIDMCERCYKAG